VARDPVERTQEERERAAAERAARRTARDGRAAPPPPPPADPEPEPYAEPRTLTAVQDRPLTPPRRRAPARRPPPPRRRQAAPGGHARRRIGALLALIAIGAALFLINKTFQPFHGQGSGSVAVKVPEGADAGKIGDVLERAGVVDSATFFQVNATLTGRRDKLRPGAYTLRRGMSYGDAIEALQQGPKVKVVKTVNVTVPEGLSIREAAPKVDGGPLEGSYLKAARGPAVLQKARRLGAPSGAKTAEGFLFPATYTLVDGAPMRHLVDRQLAAFRENFGKLDLAYAKRKNLTRYDVLIIASMVERETMVDRERPLVAAVIYNRLSDGMTLGIDATIRYVENNWSSPLKVSELERDTPYNTRLNRGLPPTPIGSPGLASLRAAANPARKDYLFYVAKVCGEGAHEFSSTDAQFQRDVAAYDAARAKRGGKSPTSC
jgi:uncharacterized YceG family protein